MFFSLFVEKQLGDWIATCRGTDYSTVPDYNAYANILQQLKNSDGKTTKSKARLSEKRNSTDSAIGRKDRRSREVIELDLDTSVPETRKSGPHATPLIVESSDRPVRSTSTKIVKPAKRARSNDEHGLFLHVLSGPYSGKSFHIAVTTPAKATGRGGSRSRTKKSDLDVAVLIGRCTDVNVADITENITDRIVLSDDEYVSDMYVSFHSKCNCDT
jgi:hypothetical protein